MLPPVFLDEVVREEEDVGLAEEEAAEGGGVEEEAPGRDGSGGRPPPDGVSGVTIPFSLSPVVPLSCAEASITSEALALARALAMGSDSGAGAAFSAEACRDWARSVVDASS